MPNLDGLGLIRNVRANPGIERHADHHAHHGIAGVAQAGRQSGRRDGLDREAIHQAANAGGGEKGDRVIDKFKQGFQEEARELLVELESALLELDQNRDDREVVGRAFRALHTIKGSGAMFGFDDIAGFAHNLETAFDRLRKGQLAATADLINLSLAAGDQIKTMLDGLPVRARGSGPLRQHSRRTAQVDGLAGTQSPEPPRRCRRRSRWRRAGLYQWRIRFRPGPDVLLNGTNPLLLLREMRELGELRIETRHQPRFPPLGEIDPEHCYVAWDMVLTTAAAPEAIRDIFIFVERRLRAEDRARAGRMPKRRLGDRESRTERRERSLESGAGSRVEHSGVGRKAGPTRQSGGELVTVRPG